MTTEQLSVLVFMTAAVFVLVVGGAGIGGVLFIFLRAFVKFANVQLVFKQADAFGRAVEIRRAQSGARPGLPTRPDMLDTDDDALKAAAGYREYDDDDQGDDDKNDDGKVRTTDENSGYDPTEPPVGGSGVTVGGRVQP